MIISKRETPQAIEERGMVKANYARFSVPVLFWVVMIVALCSFIPFIAGFLYGGSWVAGMVVYPLVSLTLAAMIRTLPKSEGEGTTRPLRWSEWSLFTYFSITGVGLNWACAFVWFSRRYAFFSTPVIVAMGLMMAIYAALAFLAAWFESWFNNAEVTGVNWRTALLVFAFGSAVAGFVVLRLGLLR